MVDDGRMIGCTTSCCFKGLSWMVACFADWFNGLKVRGFFFLTCCSARILKSLSRFVWPPGRICFSVRVSAAVQSHKLSIMVNQSRNQSRKNSNVNYRFHWNQDLMDEFVSVYAFYVNYQFHWNQDLIHSCA